MFILTVLVPLIYFILWCCLEKRNCDNERETGDEDHERYLAFSSQCITWFMGGCIVVSLLSLIAFMILLCVGMERINHSLTGSSEIINETLPLVRPYNHVSIIIDVHWFR